MLLIFFFYFNIIIIGGTTCRSKCDVRMNNIESRMIPWKALFLRSAAFHTNLKLVWGRETTEYILSSTAHHQKMVITLNNT